MDLFAGCGGFAEGFRTYRAGGKETGPTFRTVAAVDFDQAALATFEANHPQASAMHLDIEEFAPDAFAGRIDVVTGGPPCQGFSGLGKQRMDDPRNALWREYTRVVSVVQPKVFVLENVDRFLKSYEYAELLKAVQPGGVLSDYTLEQGLLNSADYGVPQARKRVIVIGTHRSLGAPALLPAPTHMQARHQPASDLLFGDDPSLVPWVPVDRVFDLSSQLALGGISLPRRSGTNGVPGPFRTRELHVGRTPTALSEARYRAIPLGGNRKDLRGRTARIGGRDEYLSTESWDGHHNGSGDVMGRLRLGRPSVTIRTEFFKPEKGRYLHPVEHRPITHYEAALIQGFHPDYLWHGTKIQIARQIGNAVPVGLARAIAGTIHKRLVSGTGDLDRADAR
ncbi:DNA cytosine methyltransferase [Streptomyces sp. NPDC056224]|uniref:DNA cytosine methyltransferase n=1 Tax=Streptomyces sp. NPDC056224 TaxID=3345750 RepID=UPI0035DC79BB